MFPLLAAATLTAPSPWFVAILGFMALLGHCYSPFLWFSGGKGVATALGVILALSPQLGALGVLIFAVTIALSRRSAIASLTATATVSAAAWFAPPALSGMPVATVITFAFFIIVLRHQSNLAALRGGSDPD